MIQPIEPQELELPPDRLDKIIMILELLLKLIGEEK